MISNYKQDNGRIAKNTLLLYMRTILVMFVSLFTSRVVLSVLGVDDYGIYNIVGGVVAMFTVVSGALSAAISRFITFELGRNDIDKLKCFVIETSTTGSLVKIFATQVIERLSDSPKKSLL